MSKNRRFAWFTWTRGNQFAAILHGKSNTTAAVPIEHAPLIRGYHDCLTAKSRKVYEEKLKFNAGIDLYPLSTSFFLQSMNKWPEIEFPEIVNYLLLSSTNFSREQLKAFKSFRSYQYFVAGWARGIFVAFLPEAKGKYFCHPIR